MKYQLLLLSLLAAISFDHATGDNKIKVQETADGIKLSCDGNLMVTGNGKNGTEMTLSYRDDESGEYTCDDDSQIYVKFRTCDNCIELDTSSIVSLAVGDIVATVVVGVAVYLIASQARTGQVKPTKKRSDKQNLIHNEAPNDPSYQPLKYKRGRDEYDVLNRK
ncbi:T-cell surface glycoprotein CD3 delta chain isoform X2 [Xiphophorus couchianus]|uniref:T-cell surface glycoprotein CD3 delta chain isoform X2 n=1 Tax=Xiphophorus couchianus TaxID=32473 RepID=UPI0010162C98|nr:T-cell surface glycoprotein CD3 delta chain-like isoform X2 [Xiphophorus couchianus]